jgi:hypothetical protein
VARRHGRSRADRLNRRELSHIRSGRPSYSYSSYYAGYGYGRGYGPPPSGGPVD